MQLAKTGWLQGWLDAGLTDALSAIDSKHVRATNLVALLGAAIIATWVPLSLLAGSVANAAENVAVALGFLAVVATNRAGHRRAASTLLLSIGHAQLAWALFFFGKPSGSALYYAFQVLGPYLVFCRRDRPLAHAFALLGAAVWVASTVFQAQLPVRSVLMDPLFQESLNTLLVVVALIAMAAGFSRAVDETEDALDAQRERADRLLLNVLPPSIADRLKAAPHEPIADRHDEVTVLFADIVGFTPLSARLSAERTVELLNQIFTAFDAICDRAGVEKIRTIGDGYMAVSGAPVPRSDHAEVMARVALEMRDHLVAHPPDEGLQVRIGLNSGEAVAGIVGTSRFHYDLWGDTVNVAARMESLGEPGRVQIGRATWERIRGAVACEARGPIPVKGKGQLETWFLA